MRANRIIITVLLPATIISMLVAVFWNYCNSLCEPFVVNVALAVFGSSLLAVMVAYIGYFADKKRFLTEYGYILIETVNMLVAYRPVDPKSDLYVGNAFNNAKILVDSRALTYNSLGQKYSEYSPFRKKSNENNFIYSAYDHLSKFYVKITPQLLVLEKAQGTGFNSPDVQEAFRIIEEQMYSLKPIENSKKFERVNVFIDWFEAYLQEYTLLRNGKRWKKNKVSKTITSILGEIRPFHGILEFIKRVPGLFCTFVLASIVVLSYYITCDLPEIFPGIGKWYKLATDLCLAIDASFIFYLVQVYFPTRAIERKSFTAVKPELDKILDTLNELIYVLETYTTGIDKDTIQVQYPVVYYKKLAAPHDAKGWARKFDFNKDLCIQIHALARVVDKLLSSSQFQKCDTTLFDSIYALRQNSLFWALDQAIECKFDDIKYTGLEAGFSALKECRIYLGSLLGKMELYNYRPLNDSEIAFYEVRMSVVPEEQKKNSKHIPHVCI